MKPWRSRKFKLIRLVNLPPRTRLSSIKAGKSGCRRGTRACPTWSCAWRDEGRSTRWISSPSGTRGTIEGSGQGASSAWPPKSPSTRASSSRGSKAPATISPESRGRHVPLVERHQLVAGRRRHPLRRAHHRPAVKRAPVDLADETVVRQLRRHRPAVQQVGRHLLAHPLELVNAERSAPASNPPGSRAPAAAPPPRSPARPKPRSTKPRSPGRRPAARPATRPRSALRRAVPSSISSACSVARPGSAFGIAVRARQRHHLEANQRELRHVAGVEVEAVRQPAMLESRKTEARGRLGRRRAASAGPPSLLLLRTVISQPKMVTTARRLRRQANAPPPGGCPPASKPGTARARRVTRQGSSK